MGSLLRRAVAGAHRAGLARPAARFRAALADPVVAQRGIAERIVARHARSAYAREHGIRDLATLRAAPVATADVMATWWRRVEHGEPDVVAGEPVLMMEESGGTSGAKKLVPYTRSLLDEFAAATGPWLADLHDGVPALRGGSSYWSVSPVTRARSRTSGGVPIGFDDDTEYFGPVARWGLRRLLAVSPEVARIPDVERWRTETARRLVAARDLALVSVWSPTFLSLLLDEVERVSGGRPPREIWPRLSLVSCWADGPSAAFAAALRGRLPGVAMQPKGLLATEGVVSVPLLAAEAPVLAVGSHFLEFLDLDRPGTGPLLAHELAEGGRYSPLLTTGGGLWRYHLPDVVRCVGRHLATPMVRYEGRLDHVADLVGEKVSLGQAERALAAAFAKLGTPPAFALLAPSLQGGPHYALYVETAEDVATLAAVVDHALHEARPYAHARRLGQLGAVRGVRVRDGSRAHERVLAQGGQRVGAVKPLALDTRPRWDGAFEEVRA